MLKAARACFEVVTIWQLESQNSPNKHLQFIKFIKSKF